MPWLSPAATSYLENLIQPEWEIIEHGIGGSTLWFAERCKSVMAFERDADWEREVEKLLPPTSVVVSGFPALGAEYDLLLIDGEPVEERARWLTEAPKLVKPGGWVVLDNANRPEYKEERAALHALAVHVETINGNEGGTLYLVTDFCKLPDGSVPPAPSRSGADALPPKARKPRKKKAE